MCVASLVLMGVDFQGGGVPPGTSSECRWVCQWAQW
jgi:hypothetical protein